MSRKTLTVSSHSERIFELAHDPESDECIRQMFNEALENELMAVLFSPASPEVLIEALAALCRFLLSPTAGITTVILQTDDIRELPKRLMEILRIAITADPRQEEDLAFQPPDIECEELCKETIEWYDGTVEAFLRNNNQKVLYFCLRILSSMSRDFCGMNIRFHEVFDLSMEEIMQTYVLISSGFISHVKGRLLLEHAFMQMCQSLCRTYVKGGNFALQVLTFMCQIYDPGVDPRFFFPALNCIMNTNARIVGDHLRGFYIEHLTKLILPEDGIRRVNERDKNRIVKLPGNRLRDVSFRSMKAIMMLCDLRPDIAPDVYGSVAIDDLVALLTNRKQIDEYAEIGMKLLVRKCKLPNSQYVFNILFDRNFDQCLMYYMNMGAFLMKMISLEMAVLMLDDTLEQDKIELLTSNEFFATCGELLADENVEGCEIAIEYLRALRDKITPHNVPAIAAFIEEEEIMPKLESIVETCGVPELCAKARLVSSWLTQIFT